jgi:hypothetical protein
MLSVGICALFFSLSANAALTRTQEIASTSAGAFGTGAYTSAAFTPENSSLLTVVGCAISETDGGMEGTTLTIADSLTLTWTSRAATTTSPAWSYGCRIWTTPITTGASMTVSLDAGATDVEFYRLEIFSYTTNTGGATVTAGGNAIGSDADGDGAASITLSATPATSSHVIGVCLTGLGGASGTITSGSGFTQINEAVMTSWAVTETETRTSSTSTTVDWVDVLATGTGFGGATLAAFEIAETGGGGSTMLLRRRRN